MKLVIIEGPGKRDTLKKYLGADYDVFATKGHVRDLPAKSMCIDINHNFEPKYEIMPDKKEIIKELLTKAAKADKVYIATDPDREGEAIAWHLQYILKIKDDNPCRVVFNEISKNVVNKAMDKPRTIDLNLVHAQQGRRVLDRLVGYQVSPILCKKIKNNLSAGRVQSVALKLVVDKEKEIRAFKPKEYWTINALLNKGTSNTFKAALATYKGKKYESDSERTSLDIIDYVKAQDFIVGGVKRAISKSSAPAPFITSTMQQDAMNKLGMSLKEVTMTAQTLYEGVNFKEGGKTALITYIRTDSTRISPEAQAMAKDFIISKYGKEYAPEHYNVFKTKKNTQDAHEAIRPISLERTPEIVKANFGASSNVYKLYKLIYDRFVASQMSEATYNTLNVVINAGDYGFKVTGKTPLFAGFTAAYKMYEDKDDAKDDDNKESSNLPNLEEGDKLNLKDITKEQKFTKPPVRYTDATLVKAMEDKGIGRPATYAPTILVLANRNYTEKEGKYLVPTDLGVTVVEFLEKYFSDIMDITFTAAMEEKLDLVEEGKEDWQKIVADFYGGFEDEVHFALTGSKKVKMEVETTDVICDKCGANMVVREGKFGKFLACPNFPKCRNIKPYSEANGAAQAKEESEEDKKLNEMHLKCDKCGADMVLRNGRFGKFFACSNYPTCKNIKGLDDVIEKKPVGVCPDCGKPVFERHGSKGKIFYGCSGYPECKFMSWDIPMQEKCPKCGHYLTKKELKKETRIKCSNSECDYTKSIAKEENDK